MAKCSSALGSSPSSTHHHLQSSPKGPRAHPCCWDASCTRSCLSPKGRWETLQGKLQAPLRALRRSGACLNIEGLSNKCWVHRAGKSFNNLSVFISQSKYSQCDVPAAEGVFFCLDQARVLYSTVVWFYFLFQLWREKIPITSNWCPLPRRQKQPQAKNTFGFADTFLVPFGFHFEQVPASGMLPNSLLTSRSSSDHGQKYLLLQGLTRLNRTCLCQSAAQVWK